jgi:membrane-associated phospholipid phosphatase
MDVPTIQIESRWRALTRLWPWVVGLVLALAWDRAVYVHVALADRARLGEMERTDWYRTLRAAGSMWPWLLLGAAFVLIDARHAPAAPRGMFRRAGLLVFSGAASGLAAEGLKLVFRRLRPDQTDGWYRFRPWADHPFSARDLGLPSSHGAVAFGAAFALSFMYPRAAPVFLFIALGCVCTRLLEGAHFLSDAYVAMLLAYAVTRALHAHDARVNSARPISGA